jgi:hypothetical protein
MPLCPTLAQKSMTTGEYYLVDFDTVLDLYRLQGFDVENEDEEVPNILTIDGTECIFTGDHIVRGDKHFEIVIAAKDFKWDEVEHMSDDEFEDEDEE